MTADDVEVHTLPLYHCAQLDCFLGPDVYLGATSIILPRPTRPTPARRSSEQRAPSSSRRRRSGSRCCATRTSTPRDLSSLRKGYYGASAMPVEVLRGDPAAAARRRPVELLRPDRDGPARDDPAAGRAARRTPVRQAGRRSTSRPELVDDDDEPVPPGDGRRDRAPQPARDARLLADEEKTAEAFRGGWFHSGDLGYLTRTAGSTSSTARRT